MKKSLKIFLSACIIALFGLSACDPTVTGPDNTDDVRTKYVAAWSCVETGGMTYPVTISLDQTNSTQILIGNFHFLGANEKAKAIATTNNITIPSQELCANTISGSGTLVNSNKITLLYYVNNHSTIDTVHATYTK
jgi:hypothetical protein